jgi:hypothetical protein
MRNQTKFEIADSLVRLLSLDVLRFEKGPGVLTEEAARRSIEDEYQRTCELIEELRPDCDVIRRGGDWSELDRQVRLVLRPRIDKAIHATN